MKRNDTVELERTVNADFSQFYVRVIDDVGPVADNSDVSLAVYFEPVILLTTARQWGELHVAVRIHDARPDPLGPAWLDVAEVSFRASAQVYITGWDPEEDPDQSLPLVSGCTYRLRYAISNMDTADPYGEPNENYLVEFWPEVPSPAVVVTQRTQAGRYWRISQGLQLLQAEIYARGDDATGTQLIVEFADRAYAAYPDLLANFLDDVPGARKSLASTASGLWRGDSPGPIRISERTAAMDNAQESIMAVLLERALLRTPPSR